jgi:hypothetical protein
MRISSPSFFCQSPTRRGTKDWKKCELQDLKLFSPSVILILIKVNQTKPHSWHELRIRSGSAFHFYTGWIRIRLFPLLLIRIRIFLSLWCRSGSGSSAKWYESATTALQTLQGLIVKFHGFNVSLYGSIVSLLGSRVSLNGSLDSLHSSWLFSFIVSPDPAFYINANPDPDFNSDLAS